MRVLAKLGQNSAAGWPGPKSRFRMRSRLRDKRVITETAKLGVETNKGRSHVTSAFAITWRSSSFATGKTSCGTGFEPVIAGLWANSIPLPRCESLCAPPLRLICDRSQVGLIQWFTTNLLRLFSVKWVQLDGFPGPIRRK